MRRSAVTGVMASPIEDTHSAATGSAATWAVTSRIALWINAHTAWLSSSAQPGWGRITSYSRLAWARIAPSWEITITLQPVVPTSMPKRLIAYP